MILTPQEKEEYLKYKVAGCSSIKHCDINVLRLSAANTLEHELAKCELAYQCLKNKDYFIIEAEEIKTGLRRDFVNITTGEVYEFETDPKRAIRFWNQAVNVIPVNWSDKEYKKWIELAKKQTTPRRCVIVLKGCEE